MGAKYGRQVLYVEADDSVCVGSEYGKQIGWAGSPRIRAGGVALLLLY